jgi:hypothetical protein
MPLRVYFQFNELTEEIAATLSRASTLAIRDRGVFRLAIGGRCAEFAFEDLVKPMYVYAFSAKQLDSFRIP